MLTISDSSPLIALHSIDRLHLLHDIYGSITIPQAVAGEVMRFSLPAWIEIASLPDWTIDLESKVGLGPGETDAIRLGLALKPNQILLDDGAARALAKRHGLHVIGVCGILLAAKRLTILPEIKDSLDRLVATSFRVSPRLYRELLARAGEF